MSFAYRKHLEDKEVVQKLKPKDFVMTDASPSEEAGFGAKQEFKDECNINFVLRNYKKTGVLTHLSDKIPMYGEVKDMDLQTAMNVMIEAQDTFMKLPAACRKEFDHDPLKFIEAAQSVEKHPILEKHGLYDKPKEVPVTKVEVVNPPSAKNDDLTTNNV